MAIFCSADLHIGHRKILQYCNRPFHNVQEMDEALIYNWNKVVGPNDTVHFLGDFAFTCTMEYALGVIKRLNGTKHLIVGNHDELALGMNDIRPNTWKTVKDLDEIMITNSQRLVLCHYPLRSWHHCYKNVGHIFGHVHGQLPPYGKSFDVGVDCWNYTPVSAMQICSKLATLPNIHAVSNR